MNKKRLYKILFLLLIIIFIVFVIINKKDKIVSKYHYPSVIDKNTTKITCTYGQLVQTYYKGGKISHALPSKEKEPMIFSFYDIVKTTSKINYLDSTKTITTVDVYKLFDTEDRIIFVEGGQYNYFTTHTIFKKTGVAIYNKTVDLVGIPYGTMGMGSCVNY